jgi:CRISPR-associated protein Cas2
MLIVISYDIQDDKKRTRLAKRLKDFGPRVQKSVFEADVSKEELQKLNVILQKVMLKEVESIRLYRLCSECAAKITIWGQGKVTQDEDFYIA